MRLLALLATVVAGLATAATSATATAPAGEPPARTMQEVLAASKPSDWRRPDPAHTLLMRLPAGRVVIELAPAFAPRHVANIETLVRAHYFDGLAITRVQDNFVTQWGDPQAGTAQARPLGKTAARLPPEFTRALAGLPFTPLPDRDGYAPQAGFSGGLPVGRDPHGGQAWLAHCYGMVGVGRDNDPDSGSGAELYAVIGQSPRQLDRNIALVGRVIEGMDLLSALPRGHGDLGFYQTAGERTTIESVRMAADLPKAEQVRLELLRTDTPTFAALVESRRNRRDAWYKVPSGHIDLCNVPLPVRDRNTAP
jgi:peptidylprolyl isomerase